jgi:hypothetical protein
MFWGGGLHILRLWYFEPSRPTHDKQQGPMHHDHGSLPLKCSGMGRSIFCSSNILTSGSLYHSHNIINPTLSIL